MAALLTSTLLLMFPSVLFGKASKVPVFDDSATLTLSCYPQEVPLISGTLSVTVVVASESEVDQAKLEDVHLSITVNRNGITPKAKSLDAPFDPDFDSDSSYGKIIPVTFSVSSTLLPLQQDPIPVMVLASLESTPLTNVTASIIDNRVGIGFLSPFEQIRSCYPNKSCDLSLKVSRNTPFVMSISLVDSKNKTVNHTSFTVEKAGNLNHHTQITAQEVGNFTAILSVPKENESLVVWTRQSLQVHVIADPIESLINDNRRLREQFEKLSAELKEDIQKLQHDYSSLNLTVNELETHVSVSNSECEEVTCRESHTCKDGKCICITEKEEGCHDYVPCDYCGSRGICEGSLDDIRNYTCECLNENVAGRNCTVCKDGYCSSHGDCSVSADGLPSCECNEPFSGPNCGECKDDYCSKRGNCTVSAEGQPTCQCDEPYIGQTCEGCDDTFCGDLGNCTVSEKGKPTCQVCIVGDRKSCNGGVCIDGGLRCNCTNTSNIGPTCDVERTSPTDNCSPPCLHDGKCTLESGGDYVCTCPLGFSGDSCEDVDIPKPPTLDKDKDMQTEAPPTPQSNSTLLYGTLALFIAVLVVCVAAYLAYHNREKIFELFGVKKETVVEMAMRSRTKNKGYKKLPTSIHDTLTHED